MKILFCGYRQWALNVCSELSRKFDVTLAKTSAASDNHMSTGEYDLVLFVGWSWIIPDKYIRKYKCLCVHPSPLPKYRGGCPLQHQIIDGVEKSAISIFIMDNKLDHGPILSQTSLDLTGELGDVMSRLAHRTEWELGKIIERLEKEPDWTGVEQAHSKATIYKRRTPSDSEIKVEDFNQFTAKQLYNKIRALQDPYPNAYITCKDGTKLYLTQAKHEQK